MRPRLLCTSSLTASVLALTVLGASALAGPLHKSRVAPDAQWLAHIDVEAFVDSQIMQFIKTEGDSIDIDLDDLEQMRKEIGLDPLKDVKDITAYGNGNPENDANFVAVFTTTAAVDQLVEKIKTEAPSYKQFEQIGRASWRE